jgi:parvulin-like peptidyl-prolyl isomerase
MTIFDVILFAAGILIVSIISASVSFSVMRRKSERERQSQFESKLREMLAERNRSLSKLVESLLFENIEIIRGDISESDYKQSRVEAMKVVDEMHKVIDIAEADTTSSAIVSMTLLQQKLQGMVDNLDSEIVAREEARGEEKDYKTLN